MKITFVHPTVNISGGIRVVAIYAQMLASRGHDVHHFSVTPRRPSGVAQLKSLLRGRGIIPWTADMPPSHLDDTEVPHTMLATPTITADQLPDADVVVATWWETAEWVNALPASKGAKAYFAQDYGAAGQEIEKISPSWAMPFHFITLTETLKRLIRSYNPTAPIRVVPNSVDQDLFSAPIRGKQSVPTVGLLYRNVQSKGMQVAFDAMARARLQMPSLEAVLYGSNPLDAEFLAKPWVRYRKSPDNAELSALYAACDVWLFPSHIEGFGLPILEAMACRTPVVSTKVGAAPDLIRQDNGRLVDAGDSKAMAVALLEVLNLPEAEWMAMSQTCRNDILSYSWADATDQFEAVLIEATQSQKADSA